MADASVCHQLKSSFRCRRCRYCLLQGDAAELEAGCSLCPVAETQSPVWYLQEVNLPTWIQKCIEEASWTKGKLLCPKCGGRLGSFDFTAQAKCGLGLHPVSCLHLVRSRVDRFMASPPVARVKPFQAEEGPSSDCLSFENHQDCLDHSLKRRDEENSESCSMELCWHSCSMTNDESVSRENSSLSTNCTNRQGTVDLNECTIDRVVPQQIKGKVIKTTTSLESDQLLLQMLNKGHNRNSVTNYITSKLKDDKEGIVQYCHHSCLLYPKVHSNCSRKTRGDCHRSLSEELQAGELSADIENESGVVGENSDTAGAQTLQAETNLQTGNGDEVEAGDITGRETVLEQVMPSSRPMQEDPEDFLRDWDLLEDLDDLNSSIQPSQTRRAELRRERNRRKREKRKLRRRGNLYFQVLDQDIKGIPPSKFEEVTGLSLGDKTVQEYIICSVCLDLFFNPRACSPCGHLFCEQCLRQLTRFHPTSTPCPLCRTVIQLTIPHESLNNALRKLFPVQTKQRRDACGGVKQVHPLPRTKTVPSVWLPLFSQQMMRGRNRRRMFWSLQPNGTLDYHDFGRIWVQTLRWRFTVAGYGLLALLFVCACSVLVINFL